jgi:hypothetical protein
MSGQSTASSAFLGLEGLHVFITGAASGIGRQAVREFLGTFASLIQSIDSYFPGIRTPFFAPLYLNTRGVPQVDRCLV